MTEPTCHTCVFAYWDKLQWLTSLPGFAPRPVCANQPDAPGRMRPTPTGGGCRNYRARPADPDLADGSVKRIPVTGGLYAYVDAADYEWLSQYRWCLFGGKYAARYDKGKMILMHREIMQTPPDKIVDHKDGNGMDNCRCNLRNCSRKENMRNRAKRLTTGACRYKGVFREKRSGKLFAKIFVDNKPIWLGYHDTEEQAARAYDRKAVECFREFAHVNFPDEWPPQRRQQIYDQYPEGPQKTEGKKVRRKEGKKRKKKP
jgi:hypothetical protein